MMRMHRLRSALLALVSLAAGGCAYIVHGKTQTLRIETAPPGATATVWPGGATLLTPGEIMLPRKVAHTVRVELAGYCTRTEYVDRVFSTAFYFTPLLIGRNIDLNSGAAFELTPSVLTLQLSPIEAAGESACVPSVCR